MERIEVSPEVAEVLGPEDQRLLEVSTAGGYKCVLCQRAATLNQDPAVVILFRDGILTVVRLAHAACGPSRIVDVEPGSIGVTDEGPANGVAALIPAAGTVGVRPLLIIEPGIMSERQGTDRVDTVIRTMIEHGLHLISRIGRTPPPASAWSVTVTGRSELRVDAPGDLVVYDGQLPLPPGWERLAITLGGCELFVGVGLSLADQIDDAAEGLRRLRAASQAGLLAGGVVPISAVGS